MTNNENFIRLNNVRIVYPSLFEPRSWKSDDGIESAPKFETTFILDKQGNIKEINAINNRTNEILIPHKTNREKLALKGYKHLALRDPQVLTKPLDAYENSLIIKATSNATIAPMLFEKDAKTRVTDKNRFYSGCYVNAVISLRVTTKHDMYVGANLHAVQFLAEGEQIGGVVFNPEGMFAPVVEENNGFDDINVPF